MKKVLEFTHTLFGLKNLLRFKGMKYWEDADWERWDSVAEHSYRMAMLAIMLEQYLEKPVNLLKTLKMILIHDIVELVTGDYSPMAGHAFDPKVFADKYQREIAAAKYIFGQLENNLGKEFQKLFSEYINTKAQPTEATPEGRFAYALDKIEAVIQIIDWRSIKNNWSKEHHDKSISYMFEWCSYDSGLLKFCKLIEMEGLNCIG